MALCAIETTNACAKAGQRRCRRADFGRSDPAGLLAAPEAHSDDAHLVAIGLVGDEVFAGQQRRFNSIRPGVPPATRRMHGHWSGSCRSAAHEARRPADRCFVSVFGLVFASGFAWWRGTPPRPAFQENREAAERRAAETVNGLRVVADGDDVAVFAAQTPQQFDLRDVGVLKFNHDEAWRNRAGARWRRAAGTSIEQAHRIKQLRTLNVSRSLAEQAVTRPVGPRNLLLLADFFLPRRRSSIRQARRAPAGTAAASDAT